MQKVNSTIFQEITPLTEEDCLYVSARRKDCFNFPIHKHAEFELNFIEAAAGAERIVGDSIETIGDYELVLVGNSELEHGWNNGTIEPGSRRIYEITIQFSRSLFSDSLLAKKQFSSIRRLLELARKGVCFSLPTILKCRPLLNSISVETKGFYAMTTFLDLLFELSNDEGMRTLASRSFAQVEQETRSRRIRTVCAYIDKNYATPLRLKDMAELTNMSEAALSRFFKQQTGKNITEYIIDIRVGHAAKELIETEKTVAEICYSSGFNNISNFDRLFKRLKGCSPKEFRDSFRKRQMLV